MILRKISLVGAALLATCFVTACVSQSPLLAAQNVEAEADALYGEYVIAEEEAAKIMANETVPDNVKLAIQQAHKLATPAVEAVHGQKTMVGDLKVTSPDDLPGAILALDGLITAARPLVDSFKGKVGK